MKSVGYPDYKAGAVEVACSTNGQLMPPIRGAAAFVPAVVSYITFMYITHLEASKLGLKL